MQTAHLLHSLTQSLSFRTYCLTSLLRLRACNFAKMFAHLRVSFLCT